MQIASTINSTFNTDIENWAYFYHTRPDEWYYEDIKNNDTLLVTVGDSWTWGSGLDNRLDQIYGRHLANLLSADWVNIAYSGIDNITAVSRLSKFIAGLEKQYKNIQVVITLTESGRELNYCALANRATEYNLLKGADWPEFADLLNYNFTKDQIDRVMQECITKKMDIGAEIIGYHFYRDVKSRLKQLLLQATDMHDFIARCETFTLDYIDSEMSKFNNVNYTVGRNFTYAFDKQRILGKIWTEVIAERGLLEAYPPEVYLLSSLCIYPMDQFLKQNSLDIDTEGLLESFDLVTDALDWLNKSPSISDKYTAYPLLDAHQWWAEYIYQNIAQR